MVRLAVLLGFLGCASAPTSIVVSATSPKVRSTLEQFKASLVIHVVCQTPKGVQTGMLGSGVITGDTSMLTAYHVVDDPNCIYFAVDYHGVRRVLTPRHESKQLDISEFAVSPPFAADLVNEIDIGDRPVVGERVCSVSRFPNVSRFCGEVSPVEHGPSMDLEWYGVVEPGNSGSGVYNAQGHLVALTTRVRICSNGQYCFAYGSSLVYAPWIRQ